MYLLSKEYTTAWSWCVVNAQMFAGWEKEGWKIDRQNWSKQIRTSPHDAILAQHATVLPLIGEKRKVACRLGGPRTFNQEYGGTVKERSKQFDEDLQQVGAIIALNKYLYSVAEDVVAGISEGKHKPPIYLMPNGLDLNHWQTTKRPRRFAVGFCGNISSEKYRDYKGYDFVVEACQQLGLHLTETLYRDKQLPYAQMRENFYATISVLVLPTAGEGSSNTIMEAMACGVPVITTAEAGYHGDFCEDGKNIIFCERSTASVRAAIKRLKGDYTLRRKLALAGRTFAEEHHDIKIIGGKYKEILEQVARQAAEWEVASQQEQQKDSAIVRVRVERELYEDSKYLPGQIIMVTEARARQLGKIVTILGGV